MKKNTRIRALSLLLSLVLALSLLPAAALAAETGDAQGSGAETAADSAGDADTAEAGISLADADEGNTTSTATDTVTVTFTLLGDDAHSTPTAETGVHTLAGGDLTQWFQVTYDDVEAGTTILDVMLRALKSAEGISYDISDEGTSAWVNSITRNGVELEYATNGTYASWMLSCNGSSSCTYLDALTVDSEIVFYYTDDWSYDWGYGASYDASWYGTDQDTVTVTFALWGDTVHGDDGVVHTLADGTLTAWLTEKSYTVAAGSTIYDLIQEALAGQSAITIDFGSYGSDGITYYYVNTGTYTTDGSSVTLYAGANNGYNSSWLVSCNGSNACDYSTVLSNGDKIVLYFTDDYNVDFVYDTGDDTDGETTDAAVYTASERAEIYAATGAHLASATDPIYGNEWAILGLLRAGYDLPDSFISDYYDSVVAALEASDGVLSTTRYTEYSRVILALTAAGYDVTDVGGYDLLEPLADYDKVILQGLNGAAYALLALDSGAYDIPDADEGVTQTTREALVACLLASEISGGGWAYSGTDPDPDMTAIVLQALAPYRSTDADVQAAVERGLAVLSQLQGADGGYSSYGTSNSCSCAQVLVALTALGIDPDTDERFLKNGVSVVDALCAFYVSGGGFAYEADGGRNATATFQGYYALVAYYRSMAGQTALYDMTDVAGVETAAEGSATTGTDATTTTFGAKTGDTAAYAMAWACLMAAAGGALLLGRKRARR